MNNKTEKIWEQLQYVVLFSIMVGQATTTINLLSGQALFLIGNIIGTIRAVILNRPRADIVKEVACLALTIAIIAITIF